MSERNFVQNFDWGLIGLTFTLAAMGMVTLYSAVNAEGESFQKILVVKQLVWYCVGTAIMTVSLLFNYKSFDRWASAIYWICMIQLTAVLFVGKYVAGSRRWLALGPISVQPSELAKIAVIVMLARYYAKMVNPKGLGWRDLFYPFMITGIPFALIVRQPDLGTAMLILLIAASVTLFVKIEIRSLTYLTLAGLMSAPLLWFCLKGYQKQRILTFLDPDRDPLGAGYHIIQSKIAIGSGMLSGKGLLKGTQNALSFLPEQHTDFIFSVMSEEMGFVGSLSVILVFLMLIVWGLNIAYGCRDPFGTILSVGVTAMIFWQAFINIGMVMGLMPVVGVPLPFISYGGSSVMTMMTCIAILMNVSMRRFTIE
jgi:rod shape determining protein RodA